MAEIRWTEEAHRTLHEVHDFIASDNPDAAGQLVTQIYEKAQMLCHFPEIGQKYSVVEEGEIRILLYGHYRIAYLLRSASTVDVLGVFHGALDIDMYLS